MLLRSAVKLAPPDVHVTPLDIQDIPLYNADLDLGDGPAAVKRLRDAIRAADALLIVTPEHNHCMSATTKNVIEWASRPVENSCLDGKPAAVTGASPGAAGTVRAQIQVRQTALETGLFFLQDPELRVAVARAKFNERGELIDDATAVQVTELLSALAAWTRRLHGSA